MKFVARKRRQPPAIIIISLIDILIVLLIFLMVTTTFKNQPALKLSLPETKQKVQAGASESHLVVTIAKTEPYLYLAERPLTLDKLQQELVSQKQKDANVSLSIRADRDAPFGMVVKVMDAAKVADIKPVNAFIKVSGGPN